MTPPDRTAEGIWLPVAGVDAAARAAADRAFLQLAQRRARADGETGVFANEPIAAGTVLIHRWHDDYYRGMVGWSALTLDEINTLPPPAQALFLRYGLDRDFGSIFGPDRPEYVTTLDNFINHSCEPNLGYDEEGNVVARRDLVAGEELYLDYGGFVVNYDEPFVCRCGAASCRGRITRLDWMALAEAADHRLPPFVRRRARGG